MNNNSKSNLWAAHPFSEQEKIMENQHQKIKGYRDLSQEEINLMNKGKEIAELCGSFIDRLEATEGIDLRNVALAKTNLQQGFMWAVRAIAKPTTF